jgi:D-alanyl-D-alanine carboxypeptidase
MRKSVPVFCLAAAICCLLAASLTGQADKTSGPPFPPTPAGKSAQSFFEAFNAGDPSRLERFFAEHVDAESARRVPPADRASRLMTLRREFGKVTLRRADAPSPDEVAMIIQGEKGRLIKMTLKFGPAPGRFFLGLGVDDADPADVAGPPPPMTRSEALAAIERELDERAAADRFSGVVLISQRVAAPYLKAWGSAGREFGAPNRTDTKFNLGSINKIFTKTAIAQLVEKGKLKLDDTLGRLWPDYPNKDAAAKVTVRQLIAMRSGIGDFFGPTFDKTPKDAFRRNGDFLPMFAGEPLAFEPGSEERYSNGGYVVLGEIVARVSGLDYHEYIRRNVFGPAGMASSDSYEADAVVPNLAEGYTRRWDENDHSGEPLRTNIYTRPARGGAAGGGYSTAEDLLRFVEALRSNKLLSAPSVQWMLGGPEPAAGAPAAPRDGVRGGMGIAGGAPGINAALEFDGASGPVIIVLANIDPPVAMDAAKMIRRTLAAVRD